MVTAPGVALGDVKDHVEAKPEPVPWRGSSVTLSNAVMARSFDQAAELTYNPKNVLSLNLAPLLWLNETVLLNADFSLYRELTEADNTTQANEMQRTDLTLGAIFRLWKMPGVGINSRMSFGVVLPVSEESRQADRIMQLQTGVGLSRFFFGMLLVRYNLGMSRYFHRYTTGQLLGARIPEGSAAGSSQYRNTGVRNNRWMMSHTGGLGLFPWEWLNLSASVTTIRFWLYDEITPDEAGVAKPGTVPTTVPQIDHRDLIGYTFGAAVTRWDPLTLSLTASTFGGQLTPNSEYRQPFFNRNTNLILSATMTFGALFQPFEEI